MSSAGVLRKDGNQKNKYSHTTSTHFSCYLISLCPGGWGNVNTKKNKKTLRQRTYGSFIFFRARSAVFGRTGRTPRGTAPETTNGNGIDFNVKRVPTGVYVFWLLSLIRRRRCRNQLPMRNASKQLKVHIGRVQTKSEQ